MRRLRSSGMRRDRLISAATCAVGALLVAWLWVYNMQADGVGPAWDYYDSFLVISVLSLFFVPIVLVLLSGEEPAAFGFALADSRRVRLATLLLYAGMLAILVPISGFERFRDYYPIFKQFPHYPAFAPHMHVHAYGSFAHSELSGLIYGWISYGMYMFCWEFFFRGFLLFGLSRTIGWWAVLVQATAFGMLHWGKPLPELAASFVAGIILGFLALRAKSFVPGFFLHWASFVTLDVLIVWTRH